jgi:NAD(P)-dependent dehydrogenase (short-subunit alcohol dehydrogenase family)
MESRLRGGDRLLGKVAIVTGAGHEGSVPGTGVAMARLFVAQGARVGIVDIDAERAENTRDAIRSDAGESDARDALVVIADVTDPEQCSAAVDSVTTRFGRLDVLVNNAAISGTGRRARYDLEEWRRVLDLNLMGVVHMCAAAVPQLTAAGGGAIVNISSIAATRAFGVHAYSASKAGVMALTRDLALTHGRDGIRANCIVPGHLVTPMGTQGGEELRELRRRASMLGTEGDAWDVAWAAVFLASDESRWITAATLPVDAGTTEAAPVALYSFLVDEVAKRD